MIALALLGLGLTVLIKSAAGNIFNAQQAHMMGVVTDLARAKMYDIEEKLLKDGFSDTDQSEDSKTFDEEGWPSIQYSYKVEEVELPSYDQLQALAQGQSTKSGSGAGGKQAGSAGKEGGFDDGALANSSFANSTLGGMMQQFSGFGGGGGGKGSGSGAGSGDIGSAMGASFVQAQYSMFQQILKVSIRKVSLTVKWQVMGSDRDIKVVAFFTDAPSMDKVLSGTGAQDLDDANAARGSGKGSGKGSGSGSGNGTPGGGGTPPIKPAPPIPGDTRQPGIGG
jgi:general secretion pathway protein I